MSRGRHRHSPPLHRMLPPSAIAGVSLVCALAPWVFTQPMTLRLLAAAAAATAVLGAVVMRHWDAQAGKQVAELTRARASDEWRFEERVAELESDLDESRELRVKLEQRLRAKRAELAGLRNEHAALLRRYAAAETDRATVLEERRVLEIEAAVPARALTAGPSAAGTGGGPDDKATVPAARTGGGTGTGGGTTTGPEATADGEEEAGRTTASRAFSQAGATLFLRADEALARLAGHGAGDADGAGDDRPVRDVAGAGAAAGEVATEAVETSAGDVPADAGTPRGGPLAEGGPAPAEGDTRPRHTAGSLRSGGTRSGSTPEDDGPGPTTAGKPEQSPEDEAQGRPEAVAEDGSATASPGPDTGTTPEQSGRPAESAESAPSAPPGSSVRRPSGHFTVPTAVAVVPQTEPVRRPVSDGTFDFFGTQKEAEDDADAAEEEAPASRTAQDEPEFGPAGEARGAGRVIDLTAHDEPEPADGETADGETGAGAGTGTRTETGTKGLRSAVS
ncbi:hypothetical protein [Streptomyces sp. NEAU-W12]|uniref:hypothetical protein n=1 Tax=Streptomyces sp. NEAU-W12 TaxID=2994668 RepID=UPI00224AF312|nr:hypothetical protein [Streptomyces sp. NEAU-W12]MCX2927851.1 hypothetical protein [Streptomyces sp. NEAU-W12]